MFEFLLLLLPLVVVQLFRFTSNLDRCLHSIQHLNLNSSAVGTEVPFLSFQNHIRERDVRNETRLSKQEVPCRSPSCNPSPAASGLRLYLSLISALCHDHLAACLDRSWCVRSPTALAGQPGHPRPAKGWALPGLFTWW